MDPTPDPPTAPPSPQAPEPVSSLYQRLIQVAILLACLSLIALGVQSYQEPDADNQPAPFSCSILPRSGP